MTSTMRRVTGAAAFGTVLEWYDFFLYGTAAALVFPQLFFPQSAPLTGTLLSYRSGHQRASARLVAGFTQPSAPSTPRHWRSAKGTRTI